MISWEILCAAFEFYEGEWLGALAALLGIMMFFNLWIVGMDLMERYLVETGEYFDYPRKKVLTLLLLWPFFIRERVKEEESS